MKFSTWRVIVLSLGLSLAAVVAAPLLEPIVHAATCVGANPCKACSNCKYCKRCAKNGLKCGTCLKADHGHEPGHAAAR